MSAYHQSHSRAAAIICSIALVSSEPLDVFGRDVFSSKNQSQSYGVDVSFPIHHAVSTNYPHLPHNLDRWQSTPSEYRSSPLQVLGDRQKMYNDHLEGCREAYPDEAEWCDTYEYNRLLMNLRQPSSMVNYTETGFKKIKAPDQLVEVIRKFWKQNHYKGTEELWPPGNSYINHWDAPTYLISVDDTGLRGSGPELKRQIWSATAATLEEWTEQELQPCSLYGIRVYGPGTVMLPHVDRLPLVASAMIPVAQEVDEPWPLEVYDHSGKAHNITLEPGEMFLFESHSVIHGHPFPLKGEFVALIFIHFEPTNVPLRQDSKGNYKRAPSTANRHAAAEKSYKESIKNGVGGQSASASHAQLPPYILRESPEEAHWKAEHPEGWSPPQKILPSDAHVAAKSGNLQRLAAELDNPTIDDQILLNMLNQRDENGWQVLHQGVASGSKEVVELLIKRGASINSRTHGGYGETPLRIAEKRHGRNHPIVEYLKSMGALSLGPDL